MRNYTGSLRAIFETMYLDKNCDCKYITKRWASVLSTVRVSQINVYFLRRRNAE